MKRNLLHKGCSNYVVFLWKAGFFSDHLTNTMELHLYLVDPKVIEFWKSDIPFTAGHDFISDDGKEIVYIRGVQTAVSDKKNHRPRKN